MGQHGAERVDAACARALALGTQSYTSVAAILKHRRDQAADTAEAPSPPHPAAPQAAVMHLLNLPPAPALAGLLLVATLYIARHWR